MDENDADVSSMNLFIFETMLTRFVDNYKYSTAKMLEEFLCGQIVTDHRNDKIEMDIKVTDDDVDINQEEFEQSNKILHIKNSQLFIDIFTSIKSSTIPMTYIFKDCDFITIFGKISNQYPFILVRMRNSRTCACKDIDLIYDFPIKDIFRKEISTKKKFDIILESVGYLKYNIVTYEKKTIDKEFEFKISHGRPITMINDIIGINLQIPFNAYLKSMFVCFLKEENHKNSILVFEGHNTLTKTFLKIEGNNMTIEVEKQNVKETTKLSPTTNPLIRLDDFDDGVFQFDTFTQTFKLPYHKLINVRTKLYYAILHSGSEYMFLKVLSIFDENAHGRTFGELFGDDAIIEGYRIKKIN